MGWGVGGTRQLYRLHSNDAKFFNAGLALSYASCYWYAWVTRIYTRSLTMKHTRVVSLNARQAKPGVHLVDTTQVCFIVNEHTTKCSCIYHTCSFKMQKICSSMWWNMCLVSFESWELILQFVSSGLTKLGDTISYFWCPIVMRWSLWLQQWSLWLHHCNVIHWDKQNCVTMAVDL